MVSDVITDEYTVKAVKRYSSLFSLPTQKKIGLILFVVCVFSFTLTFFLLDLSHMNSVWGFYVGLISFLIVSSTDFVISHSLLKNDKILNLRRCSALSLFGCLVWFSLTLFGSIITSVFGGEDIWIKSYLLGFFFALLLRFLVFLSVSFVDQGRIFLSSILQPVFLNVSFFLMINRLDYEFPNRLIEFFLFSVSLAVLTCYLFIFLVDRVGLNRVGIGSLSLFRAYLANWTENLNVPIELLLERLGNEQNVKLSILAFKTQKKMKAVVVVPSIHPGPFKNVGSSPLPYMIQNILSQNMNCIVQVPHGLSGHELDLTSQTQNERVLDTLLKSMEFPPFQSGITPLVRKQINEAKASCQIFGDCAFLTLTMAPKTMEDLSQDLDSAILKEAKRQGLSSAIVIDAHNSINGSFDPVSTTEDLKKAAEAALREALILTHFSFEVGTSNITPTDLSIEDGLGPGGLSALVLKVNDQRLAYITIDGNNMVSGLREEVFQVIQENGITEGEIFTTDSHTVNGVIISERGYRPVGEIKKRRIIEYIRQVVITALNNLEETRVSWRTITIPSIKTIGEGQIKKLTFIIEEVAKKAKRFAYLIFPTASIFSAVFLAFL